MKLKNFSQAQEYIFSLIPQTEREAHRGEMGLERVRYFLKLLGNPQEKIKIIHIAGTSGKGSTSYLISLLLTNLGFKTGLTISPHLLDIRERAQINNKLISEKLYLQYINELIPFVEKVKKSKFGSPTYFDLLMVLAFYIFSKEKVDYGVVETKMGGLLDYSNTVKNPFKVAVITRLGLDHTSILGKTLKEIAYQKAGIIQKKNTALVLFQSSQINNVIEKAVNKARAKLLYVKKGVHFKNVRISEDGTIFDFLFQNQFLQDLHLNLMGAHQAENCSLALTTFFYLSKRDNFPVTEKNIRASLKNAHFGGRLDLFKIKGKKIICDGAHNPQKMRILIKTLTTLYPNQKFDFLLAFKKSKDYFRMLKIISPLADTVYLTSFFQDKSYSDLSEKPQKIEDKIERLGVKKHQVITSQKQAFNKALSSKNKILIITGSLYFLSEIYSLINNHTQLK